MSLIFSALPEPVAAALRAGSLDANGCPPERLVSDGAGTPCRHCLADVPQGRGLLVAAHRPFPAPQPYAEIGPIFLCAAPCARHPDTPQLPAMFAGWPAMLVRGYGRDDRIVYGTGAVVEAPAIEARCRALLNDPRVAYIHLRSAANNCYQGRVDRGANVNKI